MGKFILGIIIIILLGTGGYFFWKGGYQAPEQTPVISPTPTTPPAVQFKEGGLEEVKAKFTGTSLSDWKDYQKDQFCIDGSLVGKPELGSMGFHAGRVDLLDDNTVDPLNPEALLLDAKDNVVGVEYMIKAESQPSLFDAQFEATPEEGHPGYEIPHWDLHLWLIDNPSGAFAPFNPSLSCPKGSLPPAPPPAAVKEINMVSGNLSFSPKSLTLMKDQPVKITFQNTDTHTFTIDELGVNISLGKTTEVAEFTPQKAGTFEYYCAIPGHREGGMVGSLTVE